MRKKIVVMSVAEMKLEVIKKIAKLENEAVLQEVLTLLEKDAGENTLSKNYDTIKAQYGDVLQKLAQ